MFKILKIPCYFEKLLLKNNFVMKNNKEKKKRKY